jgi:hypothetical protein
VGGKTRAFAGTDAGEAYAAIYWVMTGWSLRIVA